MQLGFQANLGTNQPIKFKWERVGRGLRGKNITHNSLRWFSTSCLQPTWGTSMSVGVAEPQSSTFSPLLHLLQTPLPGPISDSAVTKINPTSDILNNFLTSRACSLGPDHSVTLCQCLLIGLVQCRNSFYACLGSFDFFFFNGNGRDTIGSGELVRLGVPVYCCSGCALHKGTTS